VSEGASAAKMADTDDEDGALAANRPLTHRKSPLSNSPVAAFPCAQ